MVKLSYLKQIVNRSRPFNEGGAGDLPVLNPPRSLFRQWDLNQSLDVDDTPFGSEQPATPDIQTPTSIQPPRQSSQESSVSHLPTTPIHQADGVVAPKAIPETASLSSPTSEISQEAAPARRPEQLLPNSTTAPPSERSVARNASSEIMPPREAIAQEESTSLAESQPLRTDIAPARAIFRKSSEVSESQPVESQISTANSRAIAPEVSPPNVARQTLKPLSHQIAKGERSPAIPANPETSVPPLRIALQPTLPTRTVAESPGLAAVPMRQQEKNQGSAIHIGSIDIQIAPPPLVPPKMVKAAPKLANNSILARGFTSSFGLRQG